MTRQRKGKFQVCCLKRSLYGLEQASRQWNLELSTFLINLGYDQSTNDYSLFVRNKKGSLTALLVYVDDILLTGSDLAELERVKQELHMKFTIKDLGVARFFLGMEIYRTEEGTFLSQKKYILDILASAHMQEAKEAKFPLPTELKLSSESGQRLEDEEQYQRLVGRLLYLGLTRADISYDVQHLSQFVSKPKVPHFQAAEHVLRYLKGTAKKGIFFPVQKELKIAGFSDVDWGACLTTRKSLTGYCVFMGHALVSWKTKKQATVSRSSTEAEYRSMAATTAELVWMSYLFKDLKIDVQLPVILFYDNKTCSSNSSKSMFS